MIGLATVLAAVALGAAHFPAAPGWHIRVSAPSRENPTCLRQRTSWASTVSFRDSPSSLPPHKMIAALPPGGIIMALVLARDRCRPPRGVPAVHLPLDLASAHRSGFPGPRGDELPLDRILGQRRGRYTVDLWVFYGRRRPTKAQRAAAQGELTGVRWPAQLTA